MVFDIAGFRGEYKRRVDAYLTRRCANELPIPADGDAYNLQRLNTSAFILYSGAKIVLRPNR